jgi:hypothetical protein
MMLIPADVGKQWRPVLDRPPVTRRRVLPCLLCDLVIQSGSLPKTTCAIGAKREPCGDIGETPADQWIGATETDACIDSIGTDYELPPPRPSY